MIVLYKADIIRFLRKHRPQAVASAKPPAKPSPKEKERPASSSEKDPNVERARKLDVD